MADLSWVAGSVSAVRNTIARPRHAALVRITHWLTTLSLLALLVSGVEILISHPRFYWGEAGNIHTVPIFVIPIPASRSSVPTGYGFVLPDQNGWSRYLHFEAAWVFVLTGILYIAWGLLRSHFRKNLLPDTDAAPWRSLTSSIKNHARLTWTLDRELSTYNALQRLTYLMVIFILSPLMIWTGLAMSPAIASVVPAAVSVLGGQQSARTIHFLVTILLVLFVIVHVGMICRTGFRARMRAMTIGRLSSKTDEEL